MHAMFRSMVFRRVVVLKHHREPEYINCVDDMHDIFEESWRETKQYSRDPEYINTVEQLHPVTTETRGQVEDYSQQLDDLTKNFSTNPTNEHNDDSWKVNYLVTFFLKKMTMIMRGDIESNVIQVRKNPLHLRWMITLRLQLKIQS